MPVIPVEILLEIFTLALPQTHIKMNNSLQPMLSVAPFNVSQVCRRWRETSLSKPALWSHWYIEMDDASITTVLRLTNLLRAFNERSGAAPIVAYISVTGAKRQGEHVHEHHWGRDAYEVNLANATGELTAFLNRMSPRWRRVRFHTAPQDFKDHQVLDPVKQPFLEEIEVVSSPNVTFNPTVIAKTWNPAVPVFASLKKVRVRHDLLTDHRDIFFYLQFAPNVEKFSCGITGGGPPPWSHSPFLGREADRAILMRSLKELTIEFASFRSLSPLLRGFLEGLETPVLSSLSLKNVSLAPDNSEPIYFLSFLRRVRPELSSLSLHIPIGDQNLVECLRCLPSLDSLLVMGIRTDIFSAAFGAQRRQQQHKNGDFELCPRLSNLKMILPYELPVSSFIASAIIARWDAEPRALKHVHLGRVELSLSEEKDGEWTESEMSLRRCVREGLSLHMRPLQWPESV